MKSPTKRFAALLVLALAGLTTAGCGGSKVLKEPVDAPMIEPLAAASDGRLSATLDWVTVRNGPGSWAKNADWDEYSIRLLNHGDQPIRVTGISVIDSMGYRQAPNSKRKALVKGSRQVSRRYDDEDIDVVAGVGATSLLLAGGVSVATGMSLAAGAIYSGAAAGAALGALALGPVLAVGGISRGLNHSRVTKEIRGRATELPLSLAPGEPTAVTTFYPLAPAPRQVEITYEQDGELDVLVIDTTAALDGLHLSGNDDQ